MPMNTTRASFMIDGFCILAWQYRHPRLHCANTARAFLHAVVWRLDPFRWEFDAFANTTCIIMALSSSVIEASLYTSIRPVLPLQL